MNEQDALCLSSDAIVMLTWSNWFTELRSNRYHYATRFASRMPVYFVQPDLTEDTFRFEATEIPNLTVLHISKTYDKTQARLLNKALRQVGVIKPIFWIYNVYFTNIITSRYSALTIYHGTEDYLSSESRIKIADKTLRESFNLMLSQCDLLVAVSEGVKESFETKSQFKGAYALVTNGCDYKFYSPVYHQKNKPLNTQREKIAFYQGNIFDKLHYDLLHQLTVNMPDWIFAFCGPVLFNESGWKTLLKQPNVRYLGVLTPEQIREYSYKATVGLIPFVASEWLVERSFPLKTFEYLATGLPVVTIPIRSLMAFSDVLLFANTAAEFEAAMYEAERIRFDEEHLRRRLEKAQSQDYDIKFQQVTRIIEQQIARHPKPASKLNIAVLYEPQSTQVSTIREHLHSFGAWSRHNIHYLPATQGICCDIDLDMFDALIIHYSIRLSVRSGDLMLSPSYIEEIRQFGGYRILFIQDEYEGTETARSWISDLGIHTVYTCVPREYIEYVYPKSRFPHTDFVNTLTGYVPENPLSYSGFGKPSERSLMIGYRGRELPWWYGSLGQEKLQIGIRMKDYCTARGIPVDIEWQEDSRIYGDKWYPFLGSCRATLASESGANVFDFDGSIRSRLSELVKKNPSLVYDDIYHEWIEPNETIRMNQISPKLFEAIALNTALILFEGEYSGVLIPDVHYIPLKKDFSNVQEVLDKIHDGELLDRITEQAFRDIILSGKYSWQQFIHDFDQDINGKVKKKEHGRQILYVPIMTIDHGYVCLSPTIGIEAFASGGILTQDEIKRIKSCFDDNSKREILRRSLKAITTTQSLLKRVSSWLTKCAKQSLMMIPGPVKQVIKVCIPNAIMQKIRLILHPAP